MPFYCHDRLLILSERFKLKCIIMGLIRLFHSTVSCYNANKSALAILRKKTGFGFANIRKALELNENDVIKAEEWLKQQAKELGWDKVFKVQNRHAIQGLIGIALEKKKIAMVEVNCETDFVARNEKFKSLVELVARTCLKQPVLKSEKKLTLKVEYNKVELEKLKSEKNSLGDDLAVLVGSVGENMILKRAFCYETSEDDIEIAAAVHPPTENSDVLLGKFGAFIAYKRNSEFGHDVTNVPMDICKHIIGLNPLKIGEVEEEKELEEKLPEYQAEQTELVKQAFVFDDSVTVGELMESSGLKILDFKRFQCGELDTQENDSQSKGNDTEENVKKVAEMN